MTAPKITALPAAPSRTEPDTFSIRADALVAALAGFVTETNAAGDYVDTQTLGIEQDAEIALNAKLDTVALRDDAVAASDASIWVSGTFAQFDSAISPLSFKTYRDSTGGSSTVDPSLDPTRWKPIEFDTLSAIAASKSITMVAGFVYDTSKDSDGGAWRNRTQGTSWYKETLNTATRGATRKFPAVAVIIAESEKVTIFDGDDPTLPMWRVFTKDTSSPDTALAWFRSAASFVTTSVTAVNGLVTIGLTSSTSSTNNSLGLLTASFIADDLARRSDSATSSVRGVSISQSNNNPILSEWVVDPIVNSLINDVAMTVLSNAPVDPATGLQVPTIALATDGGVSVVTDTGAVFDLTYTISSAEAGSVWFNEGGGVGWTSRLSGSSYVYVFIERFLPTADKSTAPDEFYSNFGQGSSDIHTLGTSNLGPCIDNNFSTSKGLSILSANPTNPTSGMIAYITADYVTGYMVGDIQGAFLSSTDDTDLGTVLNSTTNYPSQWSQTEDGWTINATSLVCNGVDASEFVSISLGFAIGTQVSIEFEVSSYASGTLGVSMASGTVESPNYTSTGTYTFVGTVSNNSLIYFRSLNFAGTIENVKLKLADSDRSVKGKGLATYGTVTKTAVATGAELMAYSGFSASNYLEQPYNSDLDFGTGDCSMMIWGEVTSTEAQGIALRETSFNGGDGFGLYYTAGEIAIILGQGAALTDGVNYVGTGWNLLTLVRRSGVAYLYVNEKMVFSAIRNQTVTDTSATLRAGVRHDGNPLANGSIALLRISATAPSAEQIAKIYRDERPLFQAGVQCTLFGASDAVRALAHDDVTDLLEVGTSEGRSTFSGLQRVSNTTIAVDVAISTSNGLIIEG